MPRTKQTTIPSQETNLFDLKNRAIGDNDQQDEQQPSDEQQSQQQDEQQPTSNAFLEDSDSLRIHSEDAAPSDKVARPSSAVKSPKVKQEKSSKSGGSKVKAEKKAKTAKSEKKPSKTKQLIKGKSDADASNKPRVRKSHRFRSGTVALREIRKYQKSADLLIPKAAFIRLVREIATDYQTDLRFTRTALEALQEEAEMYLTEVLETAGEAALHAHRVTIDDRDLKFAMHQRFRDLEPNWSSSDRK